MAQSPQVGLILLVQVYHRGALHQKQAQCKNFLIRKLISKETHKLCVRVLATPNMMSNFQKKRGYMDVNRMLRAPTFNPDRNAGASALAMGATA